MHLNKADIRKLGNTSIIHLNGHDIVLQKMFAQMKPPINAKCEYVEIFGTDLKTGEKRKERITQ